MKRLGTPLLVMGCLAALTFACFGKAIFQGEQFSYRDAAHFYYPLYERVQMAWNSGHYPPLWETEENAGMPLLGNPTAAVLYPGKLIYALLPYPVGARVYTISHTLLAFATMLALLRSWSVSWTGSTIAGLSYAFGMPILFQYCNIVFLVGAAWAPLGIRAVDGWLRRGRRWAILELALVLSMETLGGDPETAYLTGAFAGLYALMLAYSRRRINLGEPARSPWRIVLISGVIGVVWVGGTLVMARWADTLRPPRIGQNPPAPLPWMPWVPLAVLGVWVVVALVLLWQWWRSRTGRAVASLVPMLAGLVAAAGLALLLSAVQLFPVAEFTGQTSRAAADGPHDIYPFSMNPVRIVQFLWPNPFGTVFHGNRWWLEPLTAEKIWVPSLYMGGLTIVLALSGFRFRGVEPQRAWLSIIAATSVVLALGEYASPLYVARFSKPIAAVVGKHDKRGEGTIRVDRHLRDGDGSPYWLLATGLPGFRQFRFPGKLLTFTVLAIAGLAGMSWDALLAGDPSVRRRMTVLAGGLLVVTIVTGGVALALRPRFVAWIESYHHRSAFGPLDAQGAFAEMAWGLSQATIVYAIALAIALRGSLRPSLAASIALIGLTADLAAANAQFILTIPQHYFETDPKVLEIIRKAEAEDPSPGPYRVHRMPIWNPTGWNESKSTDRVRDFFVWERDTLQPKYGIPLGVSYTLVMGVAELYDYEWFFSGYTRLLEEEAARQLGVSTTERVVAFPRRSFDLWTTRYFVLPYLPHWTNEHRGFATFLEHTKRVYPPKEMFSGPDRNQREEDWVRNQDFQIMRNQTPYPRSWIVHNLRPVRAVRGLNREDRDAPMKEILFSNDFLWHDKTLIVHDPKTLAWVEEADVATILPRLGGRVTLPSEKAEITRYEAERVEIDANLASPGLVVLADIYYPGWELTIDGEKAPIYRVNRMMRGALAPSGKHHLVFTYRPLSFRVGLACTVAGLAILGVLAVLFTKCPIARWISVPIPGARTS
jgi:hypothetical protein